MTGKLYIPFLIPFIDASTSGRLR